MRFLKVAVLLLALTPLAAAAARAAEPYHLRIGWVVPADLVTLMFLKPELAPHAGKSYVPELVHFQGTSSMMTAVATGDLDTASLAYSTFAQGIVHAGMQDLRVIADEFQDGVPGYHTNSYVVRNDSPIRTVPELKGRKLASNQAGSAADIALRAMLAKHELHDQKDVTIVEARFTDHKGMLRDGKVDLIPAVVPYGFDPELRSFARTLFTQNEAIGRTQMIMRVARAGFLDKHRAVMVDFMEDYLRTLRFLYDPAHHEEAVALLVQATRQPPDFYRSWAFTNEDYYRDPKALPNLEALQANVDLQHQLGFLRGPLDVKKYADLSITQEAAKRLEGENRR
jgi:ABC-type nitrate/sulfonate/bicarbonate transport system substrate-binding protein